MKIKIVRSRLFDAVKTLQPVNNSKNPLEILSNIKIEAKNGILALTATNIELTLYRTVECNVIEDGETTVPSKMFYSVLSAIQEGDIEINSNKSQKMEILSSSSRFVLSGMPVDEFPKLPKADSDVKYSMKFSVLKNLLRKTSFAMPTDDTRLTLCGVNCEIKGDKMRCVATDGRRLALSDAKDDNTSNSEMTFIIPLETVFAIQKLPIGNDENVYICKKETQVSISSTKGDIVLYSKIIDAVYPSYQQVIPKNYKIKATIGRVELIDALTRVSVMASNENIGVELNFNRGKLNLKVVGDNECIANDTIPIKYDGDSIVKIFNPKYIIEPLQTMDNDEIIISLEYGSTPIVIGDGDSDTISVVMPLRNT